MEISDALKTINLTMRRLENTEESNTPIAKCGLGAAYVAGSNGRLPNGKPDYETAIIYFTDAQLSGLHAVEELLRDLIQLVGSEEETTLPQPGATSLSVQKNLRPLCCLKSRAEKQR
jgi:hypothetical protein